MNIHAHFFIAENQTVTFFGKNTVIYTPVFGVKNAHGAGKILTFFDWVGLKKDGIFAGEN